MPRVYEVARELGVSSKEVLTRLEEMGAPASSHAASIDDVTADRLRSGGDGHARLQPDLATTVVSGSTADGAAPAPRLRRRRLGSRLLRQIAELPVLVLFALAIAIVIKTFLVQAFYIPSASMYPALRVGDRVLVEKLSYLVGEADPGDVVVFARSVFGNPPDVPWYEDARNLLRELLGLPVGGEEDYIKRVVAVGGDVVRYEGSPRRLVVNGDRIEEPHVRGKDRGSPSLSTRDCQRLEMDKVDEGCRVPAGEVFVMGDNRANSEDSRIIGPVSEDKIVGRAFVVIWPPDHLGSL